MPLVHRKKMMRCEINQLLFLQLMPSMVLIYYASDVRSSRLHLFVICKLWELMRLWVYNITGQRFCLAWDLIFWNKLYLYVQFGKGSIKLTQLLSRVAISRTRLEKSDDDSCITSSSHEPQIKSSCIDNHVDNNLGEKSDLENGGKLVDGMSTHHHHRRGCSSSILPEVVFPPIRPERWILQLCIKSV